MLDQHEYRLLSEIAHKLDYAIRQAEVPPAIPEEGPGGGATLDPALMRALYQLFLPADPDTLCERVLQAVVQVCQAERAFLMMIEDGRKLRFKVGHGMDQATVQRESGYSRTIIKDVVQGGDPVLIEDTSQVTDGSLAGLRMRSVLCVPLLLDAGNGQQQVGGVIYLDSRSLVRCFTPADKERALVATQMGAAALGRKDAAPAPAPPSADAAKVQQNFERLLDVGRTISSTLVLDDLLELVIEKVLEVTRADRGFLMLIEDEENPVPRFRIGLNWNKKDGPARRKTKLSEDQFSFSTTVTNRALETKQAVVLNDVMSGGDMDPSVSMMQMELSSVMVAPLIEKGKVLGLIYVDSKMSNREFADSDLELFEALAGQAAIGLKNAMLYSTVAVQQRMESELSIASKMQQDLCPKTVPNIRGIELVGYMTPAKEVGGDYYDFAEDSEAPGQKLAMVVGDVSGKGLGAGIVAVMARCFLRSMIAAYGMEDPSQLLGYLNHTLCDETEAGKFMTMLLMVWDASRSVVRYAAAGHENIILWRASTRQSQVIHSGGTPLGLSKNRGPTENAELGLNPGDMVVTYTDGVTEAMDEQDNEFELETLVNLVNRMGGQSPQQILDAIVDALAKHRGKREVSDDITMVLFRRI
ncbi:MAG: GAF domain-containing SpoIIE family protein phosphatase [Planctomycetota bacterium]